MKITEFKKGDLVHRFKPMYLGDRSYMGYCLEYIGYENHLLIFKRYGGSSVVTLDEDWNDDAWDYYPQKLVETVSPNERKGV